MEPSSSDHLPSYNESRTNYALTFATYIQHQSAVRQAIICDLIEGYILPNLAKTFFEGLSQNTLIFVPSNVSALIPPTAAIPESKDPQKRHDFFPGESIVGFPTSEKLTLIRLRGDKQTIEFWRQQSVIREVEQRVREVLIRDGLEVCGRSPSHIQWSLLEEKPLAPGEARVSVEIREICLRIENQLGLYETRTGKALVLRVEIGFQ